MTDNKWCHVLDAPQQNLKPSQTSSNDVNHPDYRHEVEHPPDSSVVTATHSLSDNEILPGQ